jgi:Ulp1 family protease
MPIEVGNDKWLWLGTDHWANDNILDLWSQLLIDMDTRLIALNSSRKKTLIFGAVVDIFERVQMKEWEKIKRLYRKDRMNYLDYNRFFIPINENDNHWTLLCIYFDMKTMIYIDSFHKEKPPADKDPKILLGFLEYFASFDKREFDRKDWKFSSVKGVKQVFLITFCNMI